MAYYVYELWDPIKDVPIYVGYGKHNRKGKPHQRYEDHFQEARKYKKTGKVSKSSNLYKLNVINQICDAGFDIVYKFPEEYISLSDAYKKETELILLYGRRDLGTGSLTNLDSGGRGGRAWSEISKNKLSQTIKGRVSPLKGRSIGKYSDARVLAAQAGRKKWLETPESRITLSVARQGKQLTEEHKKKISESLNGRPSPMKGKTAWNNGLTKDTDDRLDKLGKAVSRKIQEKKNNGTYTPSTKGKAISTRGKTYEEIYGKEKA